MADKPMVVISSENATHEKVDGFNKWKNEALESRPKIQALTARVEELWQKSANLDIQVLTRHQENEALKTKLEDLNEAARQNLVKKNIESEMLQKLETENEDLKFQIGYKNAKIEELHVFQFNFRELEKSLAELKSEKETLQKDLIQLNENSILDKQRFDSLKEIEESQNVEIVSLKNRLSVLNADNLNLNADNGSLKITISDLQSEIDNLNSENVGLKKKIGVKQRKMHAFKTTVIFLAVLANFLLLGKKFMGLTGENDWQTYFISYGSVLIFDLTVIFLTMVNRSKEALYFGVGVFILTFFQIGKPFLGIGLDVDFYGFDLVYFDRVISGCIYSFFFAFLSYFLSKIKTEQ